MKRIVSFSGGRTSAYLCYLMKELYGDDVDFIFMDTGSEHPATYDFIRNVDSAFNLNITCIRAVFNHGGMGRKYPNSYEIVDINTLSHDNYVFTEHMMKYGKSSFCNRMVYSRYETSYKRAL